MKNMLLLFATMLLLTPVCAKDRKADKDMPFVDYVIPDERVKYFLGVLTKNDTAKIGEFLHAGIDINAPAVEGGANNFYYQTILSYAVIQCKTGTIEYLLKHGADANMRVRTYSKSKSLYRFSYYPLEFAAEANSIEKMELLVKYGADMSRCVDGVKKFASDKGNTQMMVYIGRQTGSSGVQPNTLAVMTEYSYEHDASKLTPEQIHLLVKGGADVNAHGPQGGTALINIIKNTQIKNKLPLANAVIQDGANVNLQDRKDETSTMRGMKFYPTSPLIAAVRTGNLDMVKLLVEHGANIQEGAPLKEAKSDKIKEYLILKGAK